MTRPIITLTTDFGLVDGYVAQLKGVLLARVASDVIDITHAIPPQDVVRAAYLIDEVVEAFPPETIHVVVVDPGVGTDRAIIAVETAVGRFVLPDNGLLAPLAERFPPTRVVDCTDPDWWRANVSHTFHGRDIMAPLAAHWASGIDPMRFGTQRASGELVPLPLDPVERTGRVVRGRVLWADRFGNLVTNVRRGDLEALDDELQLEVQLGESRIGPVRRTYSEVEPGEAIALLGSGDRLEVAVNRGSAADFFAWSPGAVREVVVSKVAGGTE